MSMHVRSCPSPTPVLSLWRTTPTPTPPSSAVLGAVLAFGDLREETEEGLTLVRFSRARLEAEDMRELLRQDADRALDVCVVWDEEEAEIVEVRDLGLLKRDVNPHRRPGRSSRPRRFRAAPFF